MNTAANSISDWGVATWSAFAAGMAALLAWVPKLLGALVILLIGWAVATVAYTITDRLLGAAHFGRLMDRIGVTGALERAQIRYSPRVAVATIVKWVVLLVTFSVAADALGLPALSAGIGAVIGYIPNVIAAAVIIGLGLLLAGFVRDLVKGASASAGLGSSHVLGEVAFWAIAIFATMGAIGQLNIAPTLVQTIYTGIIAAAALASGLAFGLGLRDEARDVLAGRAMAEQFRVGDEIAVGKLEGHIQRIGVIMTTVTRRDGSMVTIPNREMLDQRLTVAAGSRASSRLSVTFASAQHEAEGAAISPPHTHPSP